MQLDLDKVSRRLWFANGILLTLTFVAILGSLGYLLVSNLFDRRDQDVRAPTDESVINDPAAVRPRAVRYGLPQGVVGSEVRIIEVRYGAGFADRAPSFPVPGAYSYSRGTDHGSMVNVIFLPPSGPGRILLDRAAYIYEISFPHSPPEWREERIDTVPWITYRIAFTDTDGDGNLGWEDARELYISDLDGGHFRRVLPEGYRVEDVQRFGADRLMVLALEGGAGDRAAQAQALQRAFLYTPRTGTLEPYPGLDSLAARAGRIVGERVSAAGPR